MTLQQLLYFLAVAETRHFTRAAERAFVAQPSLSKQVRALEDELGAPLFSRARGNVGLTPAGEALLPIARRIVAEVDTARLAVGELVGLRRGRVRVGATPSLCVTVFAEVLHRFHRDYPGIELVVEESGSKDLARALTQGELDLAVLIASERADEAALTSVPLLSERLVVASPADVDLGGTITLGELRDRPLVMFREGYDLRDTTLQACRAAGFRPAFAVQGGEMDAVLRFVEVGLGVAIVPSLVLRGRPALRGTPLTGPEITRTIALAQRTDVEPTLAARAFRAELLAYLGDLDRAGALSPGVSPAPGHPPWS
ncbi:LysR family transcriptional regulator [Amycolatopsis thermophila]|uniref:DNA-binding transcriptional LysR family regulator n=1 Tax=Amycolatopsis thermophila TaxID=206084 RepID=A0ABU0EY30_9PSEU|nr:LysR substrate-binding domain-containing protein [Amycolatopsis thermophila]MDQ0380225.1 DNA-binding transcriptional LysR family regulator [Amycolatopsis thermophila]